MLKSTVLQVDTDRIYQRMDYTKDRINEMFKSLLPFTTDADCNSDDEECQGSTSRSKVFSGYYDDDLTKEDYSEIFLVNMERPRDSKYYMTSADGSLYACSLRQLVLFLTRPDFADVDLQTAVLLTSAEFCDTKKLILMLISRFYAYPATAKSNITSTEQFSIIKDRVIRILITWIKISPRTFNGKIMEIYEDFAKKVASGHGTEIQGKLLMASITNCKREETSASDKHLPENRGTFFSSLDDAAIGLFEYSITDIAQQMTLAHSQIFKTISQEDLVGAIWCNRQDGKIHQFVKQSDRISGFVSYSICSPEDETVRATYYQNWCLVAMELYNLKNFNGLFAVVCGLLHVSVARLTKTVNRAKRMLGDNYTKISEIFQICEISNDFGNYRQAVKNCPAPCIPFIGCFQKDWIYLQETYNNTPSGLINIKKCTECLRLLRAVQKYQTDVYNFETNEILISVWENLPSSPSTAELMKISILREKKKKGAASKRLSFLSDDSA